MPVPFCRLGDKAIYLFNSRGGKANSYLTFWGHVLCFDWPFVGCLTSNCCSSERFHFHALSSCSIGASLQLECKARWLGTWARKRTEQSRARTSVWWRRAHPPPCTTHYHECPPRGLFVAPAVPQSLSIKSKLRKYTSQHATALTWCATETDDILRNSALSWMQ